MDVAPGTSLEVAIDVALERRADPRLAAYGLGAGAALVAAVVLGRPELLVTAAPLAVLVALGLADRRPPLTGITAMVAAGRLVAGQPVEGTVTIQAAGAARHDVVLAPGRGLRAAAAHPGAAGGQHVVSPARTTEHTLPFRLAPPPWGRHPVGELHLRSRRPWGLHLWDAVVPLGLEIRVLPAGARLARLLDPAEPQGLAGPHHSRARGHGSDVAELRPYQPGDRLRDVSWAATARTGQPWVAEHHPERTGTVLVVLDTLGDGAGVGAPAFDRAAGVAWTLVSSHLRVGDRVGLLGSGPTATWLAPTGGRRARLQLLDALLRLRGPRTPSGVRAPPRTLVPADALVAGVTMLQSDAFVATLSRYRRYGRSTVAIVVDPTAGLPATADPVERAARRLWRAEVEVKRATLAAAGVPAAVVTDATDLRAAIGALRRTAARPTLRRAR